MADMTRGRWRGVLGGAAASVLAALLLTPAAGAAPPAFTWSPAEPRPGQEITFTATSKCLFCTWTWRADDGASRTDTGTPREFRHRFTTAGAHTVSLSVREPFRSAEITTQTVTVVNNAPIAAITMVPGRPVAGENVTFVDASTDPDGDLFARAWDIDGDGFDDGTAASVTLPGSDAAGRTVRLQVTDVFGAVAIGTTAVGAAAVLPLAPFPQVRFVGRATRRGARLSLVSVTAPAGARIDVACAGRSCPRRISPRTLAAAQTVKLRALQRPLRAGVRIRIRVTAPARIGKYVDLRVRARRSPVRRDRCVLTPTAAPVRCAAG